MKIGTTNIEAQLKARLDALSPTSSEPVIAEKDAVEDAAAGSDGGSTTHRRSSTELQASRTQDAARLRAHIERQPTTRTDTSTAVSSRTANSLRNGFAQSTADLAQRDPAAFAALGKQAFGDKAGDLVARAQNGDLPQPANIKFVDRGTLNGSDGAYSPEDGGTVYLARDLQFDPEALQRTYNEEAAHHIDHALGGPDSAGDEGQIFAEGLARGGPLDAASLASARADNDKSTITVDGRQIEVENRWTALDIFNLATSAASWIPGAGDAVSLVSAGVNVAAGNYPAALFDVISMVPGIGDAIGSSGKLLLQNRLSRELAIELAEGLTKYGGRLKDGITQALRAAERNGVIGAETANSIIRTLDDQISQAVEMARRTVNPNARTDLRWGNPRSRPTFGHTFSQHGQRVRPSQLQDRARGLGHQVGGFTDDAAAAQRIADVARNRGPGVHDVPLDGVGARGYLPDGTAVQPDMMRVVVKDDGSVRTAFPFDSAHGT